MAYSQGIMLPSVLVLSCLSSVVASPVSDSRAQSAYPARMKWWTEARFGMFIHWGPVSLKGTEIGWSRGGERRGVGGTGEVPVEVYDNLYKSFNPTKFDAKKWVKIAKDAGMKYLVFTSRHHDGFSMFDSKLSDYRITSPLSPFGRDVVKELADACHKAGLRFGIYYSQPDWHNSDYMTDTHKKYIDYMHGQVRELLTNYGKVDVIWFDGLGGDAKRWEAETLFKRIKSLQPNILINNRCGLPGDFDTPEQTIGGFQKTRPWETCMTICNQWAWKPNDSMKPLSQCIRTLVSCAGGDGNLLFNVGPMPTGEIEPRQVNRLQEMGKWLRSYGFTIYGTRGGPYKPGKWGAATSRGKKVWIHGYGAGTVELPALPAKLTKHRFLNSSSSSFQVSESGYKVDFVPQSKETIDTILELEFDRSVNHLGPISVVHGAMSAKSAAASNVYANDSTYEPISAFDGDPDTRWATDGGTSSAWIEWETTAPVSASSVRIGEEYGSRIQEWSLSAWVNGSWAVVFEGKTIDPIKRYAFALTKASKWRLTIDSANEGPTISEIELK